MKRIIASVGLAAIGASTLCAQTPAQSELSSTQQAKPWSFQGVLRGFYDDNYLTEPSGSGLKIGSFGVDVSPSIQYNHSGEDTLLSAMYTYDLRYYQNLGTTDQSHVFKINLDHNFTERYKLSVGDSFVVAQEPTVLDSSLISSPLRISGNNIANTGNIDFIATVSRLLDIHVGFVSSLTAYQQTLGSTFGNVPPSRSAALDHLEETIPVDLRWKALEETTAILGYQFDHLAYTSPEPIITPGGAPEGSPLFGAPGTVYANSRNADSHFVYFGVDQSFSSTLNASVRLGGEYVDYINAKKLGYSPTDAISPYVDASLTYQFLPQSSLQVGVRHQHNSTDVVGTLTPVLDEESTAAYINVSHTVGDFTLTALAQGQFSTFTGGGAGFNSDSENFYILSLNGSYRINPFLSAEAGYEYDRLTSDIPFRAYVRNQVYVGLRAMY